MIVDSSRFAPSVVSMQIMKIQTLSYLTKGNKMFAVADPVQGAPYPPHKYDPFCMEISPKTL